MRHTADGGPPGLGQKAPEARGGTSSEMNTAPAAFSLNQSSVVCLPLISDGQRLIWVHSDQIDLQLDGAAELDKAFDRFPYLTQRQTAALAQRCSLHPDQVKVWFMVQRLRYGISWDYRDIHKVRRKLKSNQGKEVLRNSTEVKADRGGNKKWKRQVKESGGKTAGGVREEQSAKEGRVMGENVKQEQLTKTERDRKVEEDRRKKRKWMAVTDKMGKKRMKQGDEEVAERAGEVEMRGDEVEKERQKSTRPEATLCTRKKREEDRGLLSAQEWPAHKSSDVPPLADKQTEPLERVDILPPSTPETMAEGDVHGVEASDDPAAAAGSPAFTRQQDSPVVDPSRLPTRIRCSTKTETQLTMMKVAFSHCQYPDSEDYTQLAMVIGIPRYMLVQWFGDMRYSIKKAKPRWLNEEQYRQALANVKYRQCLNAMAKVNPNEGGGKEDWKMKLERRGSHGKEENVRVPPE